MIAFLIFYAQACYKQGTKALSTYRDSRWRGSQGPSIVSEGKSLPRTYPHPSQGFSASHGLLDFFPVVRVCLGFLYGANFSPDLRLPRGSSTAATGSTQAAAGSGNVSGMSWVSTVDGCTCRSTAGSAKVVASLVAWARLLLARSVSTLCSKPEIQCRYSVHTCLANLLLLFLEVQGMLTRRLKPVSCRGAAAGC